MRWSGRSHVPLNVDGLDMDGPDVQLALGLIVCVGSENGSNWERSKDRRRLDERLVLSCGRSSSVDSFNAPAIGNANESHNQTVLQDAARMHKRMW
jgi:hypothetical protein